LERIGRVLDELLHKMGVAKAVKGHLAIRAWPEVVGDVLSRHTKAVAVRNRKLVVLTDSPAWAQELSMQRREWLEGLRSVLGDEHVIDDILFRTGTVDRREARVAPPPQPAGGWCGAGLPDSWLTAEDERWIEEMASSIEDAELRQRWKNVLKEEKKRYRWKVMSNWKPCETCGALLPPQDQGPLCPSCSREIEGRVQHAADVLRECPWLSLDELREQVGGLSPSEYEAARERLVAEWTEQAKLAKEPYTILQALTMLLKTSSDVSEEEMGEVLPADLRPLLRRAGQDGGAAKCSCT